MSRWQEEFDNHAFQSTWKQILDTSTSLKVDDKTIITNLEELARLKKVIKYIDELLKSCDPEIIPSNIWNDFQTQSQACLGQITNYNQNRNIGHLSNANAHLDNLLTYIRPYMVASGKAARSMQAGFREYVKTINNNIESFQTDANEVLAEITNTKEQSENLYQDISVIKEKFDDLDNYYFTETNGEQNLKARMEQFISDIESWHDNINQYYESIIVGSSQEDSIYSQVETAKDEILEKQENLSKMLEVTKDKLSDFNLFYDKVFGNENADGELEGGLQQELNQQKIKHQALFKEIESLLPGATSAGLASAYHTLRKSFAKPIKLYSQLFYGSVVGIFLASLIFIIDDISFFSIKFVDISSLNNLINNSIYKLPLLLPALWLAIFASRRRSEAHRLQQEYAHKEALAKSYQSLKKQIEDLGGQEKELMKRLLDAAIESVAYNASTTLDKKHGDKMPIQEVAEKILPQMEKVVKEAMKNKNA